MDFNVVSVVWGQAYVNDFLTWSLPTHLSKRNLGLFQSEINASCDYHIFTTTADRQVIERSQIFSLLHSLTKPQFHIIDAWIQEMAAGHISKYDVMTRCHQEVVAETARQKRALIVLCSDTVLAEGAIRYVVQLIQGGKKLVLNGSLRAKKNALFSEIRTKHEYHHDGSLAIAPRDLVKLTLKHVHPSTRSLYWDSSVYRKDACAYLFWPVGNAGVIQRGIHLHPLASVPHSSDALVYAGDSLGIDGLGYAMRVCPDVSELHVIEDSDQAYAMTFDTDVPEGDVPGKARILDVASWVAKHADTHHRYFMTKVIKYHSHDLDKTFDCVADESRRVVMQILRIAEAFEVNPDAHDEIIQSTNEEVMRLRQENRKLVSQLSKLSNLLGVACFNSGQIDEAEKLWQSAIELSPSALEAQDNLCAFYEVRGRFKEAIQSSAAGVYLEPASSARWLKLGQLYDQVGDSQRAADCLKQAVHLSKKSR